MHSWSKNDFFNKAPSWVKLLELDTDIETVREHLLNHINSLLFEKFSVEDPSMHDLDRVMIRDCVNVLRSMLLHRSERLAKFSVLSALVNAVKNDTDDLSPAFWADICHLIDGIEGNIRLHETVNFEFTHDHEMSGRKAAILRSNELDKLASYMSEMMNRYESGLSDESIQRRKFTKKRILKTLSSTSSQWNDWKWQIRHIAKDAKKLSQMAVLSENEIRRVNEANSSGIPFGVTPYYASLFDTERIGTRDSAVRAQVIPPDSYINAFNDKSNEHYVSDFMLEQDTSPVDHITRRYTSILIFKPYNACPQVCVYCQRNWEIEGPMASGAMANESEVREAIKWIADHPSIKEVLVTGGDPLVMADSRLKSILDSISSISHVERIRIGSRTPVTLPMRFTPALCKLLGSYRIPGKREICVVTHIQHPYELSPEMVKAIDRLKMNGISVYNQMVFTFFSSRRFEASYLRRLIRLCGVDPYYTFYPKGKEETSDYRVPIARLLQEQKEESRLMPGLARTDEPVYNVPGLGKNHLNAWQHRDLISINSDGSRIYEFHPWEKKIADQKTYIGSDIPILDYLNRLEEIGENIEDYKSIWYYF